MAEASEHDIQAGPPQELLIDPFDFHVGVASRIRGLGGSIPSHDPHYAFHTAYVDVAPGPAHFSLRFTGLKARQGTLQLWVNMLPTEPGGRARVANSERLKLNWIVQQGGHTYIRFEAFRGVRFALHGMIVDETDAEADALVVVLDRPLDPNQTDIVAAEAQSSAYGREAVAPSTHLISLARPTLAAPVSQLGTKPQQDERVFAETVRALGLNDRAPVDQWRSIFIYQVAQRYGMLEKGALALGMGVSDSPLPAALAAHGLDVVATDPGQTDDAARALDGLYRPDLCPRDRFDQHVRYHNVDLASLPGTLVNFDLLWSEEVVRTLPSVSAANAFVEASIGCLRPGGLAIHLFPYDPIQKRTDVQQGAVRFRRGDAERLALILISRGYEVAQIKIDSRGALVRDAGSTREGSFGMVIRRPPSVY